LTGRCFSDITSRSKPHPRLPSDTCPDTVDMKTCRDMAEAPKVRRNIARGEGVAKPLEYGKYGLKPQRGVGEQLS
jgi:hypothetical protein